MIKRFIIGIINKIFKLDLTEEDFDAIFQFIGVLIKIFGGVSPAMKYLVKLTVRAKSVDKARARMMFENLEQTMGVG